VGEAVVDDPLAVAAQQRLALAAQALDLVADRVRQRPQLLVRARDTVR
jgi:hypothetical protein